MAVGSPELPASKTRPSGRFWRGLSLAAVLLGIVCPGLMVLKGPHVPLVVLLILVLPVIWVLRWRTVGFLFGLLFFWLSGYAAGLGSLGPGQVDNIIPVFAPICGAVFAILYLGPILLVTMAVVRLRTARQRFAPSNGRSAETAPVPEPQSHVRSLIGGFIALLFAVGVLYLCWTFRPRHPHHLAIQAIEEAGARVELNSLAPGEPVDCVAAGDRSKLGDGEMKYIAQFDQLKELGLASSYVTDAGLAHLQVLTSLRRLDLTGTQITDAGLVHVERLTNLDHLELSGTQITDAGLARLKALRNLTYLRLQDTQVTEQGVSQLTEALPDIYVVYGPASSIPPLIGKGAAR